MVISFKYVKFSIEIILNAKEKLKYSCSSINSNKKARVMFEN